MSHAYQLIKGMEAEASIDGAFTIAFNDDKYHDVTLKGNDGVTVAANRIVLSLRSKYFENMFMGKFKENTSATTETDFPGEVIKAVVEYIHTDAAAILVEEVEENDGQISEAQTKEFQTLVKLTEAAAYYNLPKLCNKVNSCMKLYLDVFPSLSITVLEVASQDGPVIPDDLLDTSLTKIRSSNFEMLKDDVLVSLTSSALSMLLTQNKLRVCAQQRFEIIHKWASSNPDRQSTAKNMIQNHVELHLIDPDFLSSDVEPSGLVTKDQLFDAFRHQAKKAKHDHNVSFGTIFVQPKWTHANSNIFTNHQSARTAWKTDLMDIPPLVLGKKYSCTVRVGKLEGSARLVWLGVAKSSTNVDLKKFGGQQDNCWGICGYNGSTYSCSTSGEPCHGAKFGDGSVVTLTLDLTGQEPNNGSLSISVDEGATILAISNMRDHVDGSKGFLPAVSCYYGSSATIECFEAL